MTELTPDQTPEGWTRTAAGYERAVMRLTGPFAEETVRLLDPKPGERFLDIAAGTGAVSLAAARAGADVLATDFSPGMLERLDARLAREGIGGIRTEVHDGQDLELEDDMFDVACSVFGLIFFPDQAAGFREMKRVLRPGGRAAVTVWSTPDELPGVSLFGRLVRELLGAPEPTTLPAVYSLSSPDQLSGAMRDAGFGEVRVERIVHDWVFASPEAVWDDLSDGSPVITMVIDGLGDDQRAQLRTRIIEESAARFGAEEVRMPSVAYVGLGVA